MNYSDVAKLFRKQLFEAFFDWLEKNKKTIGDKWYNNLRKQATNEYATCNTATCNTINKLRKPC